MGQPVSILSVSQYESLLQTREWIFNKAGFEVVSEANINAAIAQCCARNFDIVVIGHAIPSKDRTLLIAHVRKHPGTRVISLFSLGEPPAPEADYSLNSLEGPEKLLAVVRAAVKKRLRRPGHEHSISLRNQNSAA